MLMDTLLFLLGFPLGLALTLAALGWVGRADRTMSSWDDFWRTYDD